MKIHLVSSAFVLLLLAGSATAGTIHVPAEQPTIQAGIAAAQAGDTVIVAFGIYYEYEIGLKSGVLLRSETGASDCATIDAQQQGRVLIGNLVNAETIVEGFTITGGQTHLSGAGVNVFAGSPEFRHCRFEDNHAVSGGGGGAVAYADGSDPRFVACAFIGNTADGFGGAVLGYSSGDHPEFTDCLFVGNAAGVSGGALALDPISGSNAATLRGCTLRGNQSTATGGVIFLRNAALTLERSIIAFNADRAVGELGGFGATAALACCDLFGNQGGDWVDELADLLGIDGNFAADPFFCDTDDSGLYGISPCAPGNHPAGADCGLIGALPVNCETTATKASSWSGVKSLY
jgi:hypothetical protein